MESRTSVRLTLEVLRRVGFDRIVRDRIEQIDGVRPDEPNENEEEAEVKTSNERQRTAIASPGFK